MPNINDRIINVTDNPQGTPLDTTLKAPFASGETEFYVQQFVDWSETTPCYATIREVDDNGIPINTTATKWKGFIDKENNRFYNLEYRGGAVFTSHNEGALVTYMVDAQIQRDNAYLLSQVLNEDGTPKQKGGVSDDGLSGALLRGIEDLFDATLQWTSATFANVLGVVSSSEVSLDTVSSNAGWQSGASKALPSAGQYRLFVRLAIDRNLEGRLRAVGGQSTATYDYKQFTLLGTKDNYKYYYLASSIGGAAQLGVTYSGGDVPITLTWEAQTIASIYFDGQLSNIVRPSSLKASEPPENGQIATVDTTTDLFNFQDSVPGGGLDPDDENRLLPEPTAQNIGTFNLRNVDGADWGLVAPAPSSGGGGGGIFNPNDPNLDYKQFGVFNAGTQLGQVNLSGTPDSKFQVPTQDIPFGATASGTLLLRVDNTSATPKIKAHTITSSGYTATLGDVLATLNLPTGFTPGASNDWGMALDGDLVVVGYASTTTKSKVWFGKITYTGAIPSISWSSTAIDLTMSGFLAKATHFALGLSGKTLAVYRRQATRNRIYGATLVTNGNATTVTNISAGIDFHADVKDIEIRDEQIVYALKNTTESVIGVGDWVGEGNTSVFTTGIQTPFSRSTINVVIGSDNPQYDISDFYGIAYTGVTLLVDVKYTTNVSGVDANRKYIITGNVADKSSSAPQEGAPTTTTTSGGFSIGELGDKFLTTASDSVLFGLGEAVPFTIGADGKLTFGAKQELSVSVLAVYGDTALVSREIHDTRGAYGLYSNKLYFADYSVNADGVVNILRNATIIGGSNPYLRAMNATTMFVLGTAGIGDILTHSWTKDGKDSTVDSTVGNNKRHYLNPYSSHSDHNHITSMVAIGSLLYINARGSTLGLNVMNVYQVVGEGYDVTIYSLHSYKLPFTPQTITFYSDGVKSFHATGFNTHSVTAYSLSNSYGGGAILPVLGGRYLLGHGGVYNNDADSVDYNKYYVPAVITYRINYNIFTPSVFLPVGVISTDFVTKFKEVEYAIEVGHDVTVAGVVKNIRGFRVQSYQDVPDSTDDTLLDTEYLVHNVVGNQIARINNVTYHIDGIALRISAGVAVEIIRGLSLDGLRQIVFIRNFRGSVASDIYITLSWITGTGYLPIGGEFAYDFGALPLKSSLVDTDKGLIKDATGNDWQATLAVWKQYLGGISTTTTTTTEGGLAAVNQITLKFATQPIQIYDTIDDAQGKRVVFIKTHISKHADADRLFFISDLSFTKKFREALDHAAGNSFLKFRLLENGDGGGSYIVTVHSKASLTGDDYVSYNLDFDKDPATYLATLSLDDDVVIERLFAIDGEDGGDGEDALPLKQQSYGTFQKGTKTQPNAATSAANRLYFEANSDSDAIDYNMFFGYGSDAQNSNLSKFKNALTLLKTVDGYLIVEEVEGDGRHRGYYKVVTDITSGLATNRASVGIKRAPTFNHDDVDTVAQIISAAVGHYVYPFSTVTVEADAAARQLIATAVWAETDNDNSPDVTWTANDSDACSVNASGQLRFIDYLPDISVIGYDVVHTDSSDNELGRTFIPFNNLSAEGSPGSRKRTQFVSHLTTAGGDARTRFHIDWRVDEGTDQFYIEDSSGFVLTGYTGNDVAAGKLKIYYRKV